MHITNDNNFWIVTHNMQNSPIKSIFMYSFFSGNSKNIGHLVTGYVSGYRRYTTQTEHHIKIFLQILKLEIQKFQNVFINILH